LAGGPNQLTGKYFMEHPSLSPVEIYIDSRADIGALAPHANGTRMVNVVLRPTDQFLAAHELPRFAMHFQEQPQPATTDVELRAGEDFFVNRSTGYQRIMPFFIFEQTPDVRSFVGLSQKRGKDGTPLARLNWHIADEEIARYREGVLMFCGLLNQYGLAKARLVGDAAGKDWSNLVFGSAAHHMGTTRMGHTDTGGVVDADCRVFGLGNMFVAGASVFPNSDIVNPTLNLTALTARLANYIVTRPERVIGGVYRFGSGRDANKALKSGWDKPAFEGIWSSGDVAALTLERKGASSLSFNGSASGAAAVEVEIDGTSAYQGPANGLSGMALPLDSAEADDVSVVFHFTGLPDADGNTARHGLFLQTAVLK
jgi:hypothetical protein